MNVIKQVVYGVIALVVGIFAVTVGLMVGSVLVFLLALAVLRLGFDLNWLWSIGGALVITLIAWEVLTGYDGGSGPDVADEPPAAKKRHKLPRA